MVHSGGFEPPTFRSVAERSVQLSYECSGRLRAALAISPVERSLQTPPGPPRKAWIGWCEREDLNLHNLSVARF